MTEIYLGGVLMIRFKGLFSIVVGVSMIIMWCLLLVTGQVPEVATEPFRIAAHIMAEVTAALLLIAGGFASIRDNSRDSVLNSVALGALLYSVVSSSGYYIQQGGYAMVVMFGVIAVVSVFLIMNSVLHTASVRSTTGSGR